MSDIMVLNDIFLALLEKVKLILIKISFLSPNHLSLILYSLPVTSMFWI